MRLLIRLRAVELTKFVTLRMLEYLVRVTPVDTSEALSNWVVALGGSGYGAQPIPPHVLGSSGSSAEASAAIAIANAKEALRKAQPRKALAIINAVPYLKQLNEGSSAQAPAGFVEAAILVGRQAAKEYNFNMRLRADIRRGKVVPDG
jgi:hypothetical protein